MTVATVRLGSPKIELNIWQSLGGMEVGSIWGLGSYVAPDWAADWLHREATFILDKWSQADFRLDYPNLNREQQAQLQGRLATYPRFAFLIDEVVTHRNHIAHGTETPDKIGRRYSKLEVMQKIEGMRTMCEHVSLTLESLCTSVANFKR